MDLELVFEIEGEKQLIRRLEGIAADLKDWSPEFRKIGTTLQKAFQDNFKSEGRDLGSPWQPLSAKTVEQKIKLGYPPDILVRTGKMRDGFRSIPGRMDVVVYNTQPYFIYHQSNKPRTKLPRRVMMKLDEKRKQLVVKIIQAGVADKLKKRGLN